MMFLPPLPAQDAARHDELRAPDGSLRAPWQRFFAALPADDAAAELERRRGLIAPQLRSLGVTHNVYGADGRPQAQPWPLELLPQLITPEDWATIEGGVAQRARLLDAMLADIYHGTQRILREALLPPALVFRHPGYLRPLHGVRPPGGLHLHIAAFDLARAPDGRWWIVSQRTQGPSGLGYVLHNRLVVSRLFPEAFRELRVQHVAASCRRMLDTVETLAAPLARGEGAPRIALLTPGPANETYFEQAFLARYLGLPLVEGGDLVVRGARVFLKTVEGLQPVHGLLRRLDDDYCDPLELRSDSTLGVAGLMQAVREGNVVIANALGSAFLESPAVQGFLPGIAEELLGEPLQLASLPTWWCGEPAAWAQVRQRIPGMVQRAAFPGAPGDAARPIEAQDADAVRHRIDADPDAWVVQGLLPFSRAPLWGGGGIVMRPAMLRVYAIADAQARWHVLPGGMTRVASDTPFDVSLQRGGTSLDSWVLTDGPVDHYSMLPARLSVDDIARRRAPVASRTAEHLFWFGRYTERTEQGVRLVRALLGVLDSETDAPPELLAQLTPLAQAAGLVGADAPPAHESPAFERALLAPLTDTDGSSIGYWLAALARTVGALRERLAPEQVALVRSMVENFHGQTAGEGRRLPAQVLQALDRLALQLAALTGAQTDRMTRDHGWRLMTVGRLIERLLGMARVMTRLMDGEALDSAPGAELLLELFDSSITFRARYQRHGDLLALVDLLVLDDGNPRAFAGILRRLRSELEKLPGMQREDWREHLPAEGAGLGLADLRDASDEQVRAQVQALAGRLWTAGAALSDALGQRYFAHAAGDLQLLRT
jgi:uncharacterized circularly permuted ATP-grasp superfamily protein/uncharacterized alpha-E superfamily protein